ncbi:hypothetical protein BDF20DRAFT_182102 [Mycotypha africana]|uniref:uncharacterized protein n=1 Tax=Mycotypha africana TaxID=64632 RepID=UPI0022FFD774|nr:uncharacterized protein BDF20DRAFT_182102 [Mycotypha africana]KAI8968434.1 hypothetical protein BDF20DRAFT_182102 [Mycotypha africana]
MVIRSSEKRTLFDSMICLFQEYASLIRSTRNSSKHGDWITFSCQNCNTGDVYSIKQSTEEDEDEQEMRKKFDTIHCHRYKDQEGQISTKQKTTSPLSDLDQPIVIIHTGTVFGAEIDRIKEKSNFSHTFHIVLKPDLPGSQISLEEHNGAEEDSELRAQHRQIQHLLKESLVDMEMATKNRVEAYKAEQEMLLRRAKEKAMYDGAILWQTIKEATRTVRDKERTRYLSLSQQQFLSQKLKNNNSMSDSALMNVLKENMIQQLPSPSSSRRSSLAALGRRTSLFNIDRATSTYSNGVTSGGPQNTTMIRRSSCILNESTITNSLRRGDGTSDITKIVSCANFNYSHHSYNI